MCVCGVKLSSRAVVRAYIARIKEVNVVVNAVTEELYEKALREADEADHLLDTAHNVSYVRLIQRASVLPERGPPPVPCHSLPDSTVVQYVHSVVLSTAQYSAIDFVYIQHFRQLDELNTVIFSSLMFSSK